MIRLFKFESNSSDFTEDIKNICGEILNLYLKKTGNDYRALSELERQVLAVYGFGVADGIRQNKYGRLSNKDINAGIINLYGSFFGYSENQSAELFDTIVDAIQDGDPKNTHMAIVHQGLEGYFMWEEDQREDVVENIHRIIEILQR